MPNENAARKGQDERKLRALEGGMPDVNPEAMDTVIHERTRLAIVSTLAVNDSLSFTELKQLLDLSDGNLSVHAQKLEMAGYIGCKKTFKSRKPRTEYRLTAKGRKTLENYLSHMEALINAVRSP